MDSIKKPSLFDTLLLLVTVVIAVMTAWVVVRYWLITWLSISSPCDKDSRYRYCPCNRACGDNTPNSAIVAQGRFIRWANTDQCGEIHCTTCWSGRYRIGSILPSWHQHCQRPSGNRILRNHSRPSCTTSAGQPAVGHNASRLRPFRIYDRIALINWQYGKFPPTLNHGWLEPSYTGLVKGISLLYTKISTDHNGLLKVPNGVVAQSQS